MVRDGVEVGANGMVVKVEDCVSDFRAFDPEAAIQVWFVVGQVWTLCVGKALCHMAGAQQGPARARESRPSHSLSSPVERVTPILQGSGVPTRRLLPSWLLSGRGGDPNRDRGDRTAGGVRAEGGRGGDVTMKSMRVMQAVDIDLHERAHSFEDTSVREAFPGDGDEARSGLGADARVDPGLPIKKAFKPHVGAEIGVGGANCARQRAGNVGGIVEGMMRRPCSTDKCVRMRGAFASAEPRK